MTFRVTLSKQSHRYLAKAPAITAERLREAVDRLRGDPVPHDAKRIQGFPEVTFRVRVGDQRILYVIRYEDRVIDIVRIDKRSRVYD